MKRYIEIALRRKKLIIIPFIIVFLIPSLWSYFFVRVYTVSAIVAVEEGSGPAGLGAPKLSAPDFANSAGQLLQHDAFASEVVRKTHLGVRGLKPDVKQNLTAVYAGVNLIRIEYKTAEPERGVKIVDAAVDLLMARAVKSIEKKQDAKIHTLKQEVKVYQGELDKNKTELDSFVQEHPELQAPAESKSVAASVGTEYQRLQDEYESGAKLLDNGYRELSATQAFQKAGGFTREDFFSVVAPPVLPSSYSKKMQVLIAAVAFIAASILALAAVSLAEMFDQSVAAESDVVSLLRLPALAAIPKEDEREEGKG